MPMLIRVDVYASRDVYNYGKPEHMLTKQYTTEQQVDDILKYTRKEFRKGYASYWYMVISRVDTDATEWVKTELIKQRHPLKERVVLNADAKGKGTAPKRVTISAFAPTFVMPQSVLEAMANMPIHDGPVPQPTTTHVTFDAAL